MLPDRKIPKGDPNRTKIVGRWNKVTRAGGALVVKTKQASKTLETPPLKSSC